MIEIGFDDAGRLPAAGDNVAIASRRLEQGTAILRGNARFELDFTVMEGHRFAVEPVARGAELLSWGLPFGVATADIQPGSYVCNPGMLEALNGRRIDFELPATPNFEDRIRPYELDRDRFRPGRQVSLHEQPGTFSGYARGRRGAGTRNYAVILGTTSRTASYARLLAARLQEAAGANLDGVVAIAHTEGGGRGTPNNKELLLRTLAGFAVHPQRRRPARGGLRQRIDFERAVAGIPAGRRLRHRRHAPPLPFDLRQFRRRSRGGGEGGEGMARAVEPERAHRTAVFAAEAGTPVRRLRRLLRHLGKPAGGAGCPGADPPRRRGQSRGNGRTDRRRALRASERARPGNCAAVPAHGRALQGARRLARVHS